MKQLNELIQKYSKSGPRYTSYPPVPFWKGAPKELTWFNHLSENIDDGVDIYVHVPYCEKLCWYCGCHRTISKDHSVEDSFISLIKKEWDLYLRRFENIKVNSLHFGGGTPTFLSPYHLSELIDYLAPHRSHQFVGSIEVDPRTCTKEHLIMLKNRGFSRISLGIQDFDPLVQKAINRYQPVELVEALVNDIRKLGFKSINFDLIYGLPLQTEESITETINIVSKLDPDMIAFYGYAHLPDKISNQKLIRDSDLPNPIKRQEMYQLGKRLLKKAGLTDIGMDHFAKESNHLYISKEKHKLHRNFMGYTDKKSKILIGLGPSSISDSGMSFIQNEKDLKSYSSKIENMNLAISNGHIHSENDLKAQSSILNLMCNEFTSFDENGPYHVQMKNDLNEFLNDGLITKTGNSISLTETGKIFMRNIAMSFDFHLREQSQVRFSQTI